MRFLIIGMLLYVNLSAWETTVLRDIKNGNTEHIDKNFLSAITSKNIGERLDLFKISCDNGFQYACVHVAKIYQKVLISNKEGRTVPEEISSSVPHYITRDKIKDMHKIACKNGEFGGCYLLAEMYTKENDKQAIIYHNKAIELGYYASYLSLGLIYKNGKLVSKDIPKAYEIFAEGCNTAHDGYLCSLVGEGYNEGSEIRYDRIKALKYFGKACDLGEYSGCYSYKELTQ